MASNRIKLENFVDLASCYVPYKITASLISLKVNRGVRKSFSFCARHEIYHS
jgi:hypothetical protein